MGSDLIEASVRGPLEIRVRCVCLSPRIILFVRVLASLRPDYVVIRFGCGMLSKSNYPTAPVSALVYIVMQHGEAEGTCRRCAFRHPRCSPCAKIRAPAGPLGRSLWPHLVRVGLGVLVGAGRAVESSGHSMSCFAAPHRTSRVVTQAAVLVLCETSSKCHGWALRVFRSAQKPLFTMAWNNFQ